VSVPPLPTGGQATVYFLVDARQSTAGHPEVEFELSSADDSTAYPSAACSVSHRIVIGDALRHSGWTRLPRRRPSRPRFRSGPYRRNRHPDLPYRFTTPDADDPVPRGYPRP
jgi:hypothetical protein